MKWNDSDVPPMSGDELERRLDALKLKPVTFRLTGCFWPPTEEHVRECESCRRELTRQILDAEYEWRRKHKDN